MSSNPLSVCRRPSAARRLAGFTLTELLVVIGILAILVSILVPTVAHARRQAVIAACATNLRQYTATLHVYAQDNDLYLPRIDMGPSKDNLHDLNLGFYDLFNGRYGLPKQCFFCPTAYESLTDTNWNGYGFLCQSYMLWVPRYNGTQLLPPDPGDPMLTVNSAAITDGSGSIAGPIKLGDSQAVNVPVLNDAVQIQLGAVGDPTTFNVGTADVSQFWVEFGGHYLGNRVDVCNEAYLDGHVERVPAGQLKLYYKSLNAWNCR